MSIAPSSIGSRSEPRLERGARHRVVTVITHGHETGAAEVLAALHLHVDRHDEGAAVDFVEAPCRRMLAGVATGRLRVDGVAIEEREVRRGDGDRQIAVEPGTTVHRDVEWH